MMTDKQRHSFSQPLLSWFRRAMRPLPWRKHYDPYSVWISEIMLQQTQMDRGVRYFEKWMRLFPTVQSVAEADEEAILAAWEGLGYYSRARNLHKAAKAIMADHDGVFPSNPEDIRRLPGVGPYTAAAIASIAFNLPEPAVDANVLRIFSRILDIETPVTGREAGTAILEAVKKIMPEKSPRLFNQALMELGALVCGKTPRCGECPVSGFCLAFERGTVGERPVKKEKGETVFHEMVAGVLISKEKVFVRKRPDGGLWAGLWEFPGTAIREGEKPEAVLREMITRETGIRIAEIEKIGVVKHSYTTNRVTLHGYLCKVEKQAGNGNDTERWAGLEELSGYSFAAGHRKLLEKMGWK